MNDLKLLSDFWSCVLLLMGIVNLGWAFVAYARRRSLNDQPLGNDPLCNVVVDDFYNKLPTLLL